MTGYRATVRQKDGPFTERSHFDLYDMGAFLRQADGGATAAFWSVDAQGNLVAPAASAGRRYLSCGELTWNHLQVHARIDLHGASAGIAVGVTAGAQVPAALIAMIEPDGPGHALVLRRREAAVDIELGRAPVTVSGPALLNMIAFDDKVRAAVGDVLVEGPRGGVREGRVALVANGPAAFAGIAVDALDMYVYEFATSRYHSFQEHIDSYDGRLGTLTTGAFGGVPTPVASVLSASGTQMGQLMTPAADPQERQKLFAAVIAAIGLGLRAKPDRFYITRILDGGNTVGLLLESPEPISLVRDVKVSATLRIRRWVDGGVIIDPFVPPHDIQPIGRPPRPLPEATPLPHVPPGPPPPGPQFSPDAVTLERAEAGFAQGDRLVRTVVGPEGPVIEVFDAPQASGDELAAKGWLRETLTIEQARARADLAGATHLPAGIATIIHPGGGLGTSWGGHWEDVDQPVPLIALANGSETAILLLSPGGAPLAAGAYTVHFTLQRDRWKASAAADPQQQYHQKRAVELRW
jgi:hypothetical protein